MSQTESNVNIKEMTLDDLNEAIDLLKLAEKNKEDAHKQGIESIAWIANKIGYVFCKSSYGDCYVMLPRIDK